MNIDTTSKVEVKDTLTKNLIDDLFDKLDNWRKMPAYQLERRADIFFALYLKEVLEKQTNNSIDHIIPEFPARKMENGEVKNNLSFKIDYVAVSNSANNIFLIELKTDVTSVNDEQVKNMTEAKINFEKVINGIVPLRKASKKKTKYDQLLSKMVECKLLRLDGMEYINTCSHYQVEIIYILPGGEIENETVITFNHFLEVIKEKEDFLSKRFAQSLKEWIKN